MTKGKPKPVRDNCWYARMTTWEGERCLATWGDGARPIVATYDEWMTYGEDPEDLILFGELPSAMTRAEWLFSQGIPITRIREPSRPIELPAGQPLAVRFFQSWLKFRSVCSREAIQHWFWQYWLPRQCWFRPFQIRCWARKPGDECWFTVGEDLRWPWRGVYRCWRRIIEAVA